jgi:hypothetical protein
VIAVAFTVSGLVALRGHVGAGGGGMLAVLFVRESGEREGERGDGGQRRYT